MSRKRFLNSEEKCLPTDKKYCQITSPIPLDIPQSDSECDSETVCNFMEATIGSMDEAMMTKMMAQLSKLDVIHAEVCGIRETVDGLRDSLASTQQQLSEACEEIDSLKCKQHEIDRLTSEVSYLRVKTAHLEKKIDDQNEYSRRENLIIKGFPESKDENCLEKVNDIFRKLDVGPFQLHRFHRLGKFTKLAPKPRPMIVRFVCYQDKLSVLKKRTQLKGTNIFLQDDIDPEVEACQAKLRPVMNYIRKIRPEAKIGIFKDKLKYEDTMYTVDTIQKIPVDLSSIGTFHTNTHVYFSGQFSPLSNLYQCQLPIDGETYSSVEQYFQTMKCMEQGKESIAKRILAATSSTEAMILGKEVKCEEGWAKTTGVGIMEKAITAKLEHVREFANILKLHKEKLFVESSRHLIWGIGLPFSDPKKENCDNWKGKNLMGQLLTTLASK